MRDNQQRMTFKAIKNCQKERFAVTGAKNLYVCKRESCYFYYRYVDVSGKRRELPLLHFSHETTFSKGQSLLKQAIDLSDEYTRMRRKGLDPIECFRTEKRKNAEKTHAIINPPKTATFQQCAEEWIQERKQNHYWKDNPKGEKETRSKLTNHAYPYLGDKDIETINANDIFGCLKLIWQDHPSVADKVKTYVKQIMQWAIAKEKRKNPINPAAKDGSLPVLLESLKHNRQEEKNLAACPYEDIPLLFKTLQEYSSISARMLEFQILTAARQQAVRFMKWKGELNINKGIWNVPLENDKAKAIKRDRTIYLSSYAVNLLKKLPRFISPYVFVSSQGDCLSGDAVRMFLKGLHQKKFHEDGIGWVDPMTKDKNGKPKIITPHATARASFKTWSKSLENQDLNQEAVELCMLHGKNDPYKGAYDRNNLEQQRRAIMERWGEYCYSLINKK